MRLERGEEPLAVTVALLLDGDDPGRRRGAIEVIDVPGGGAERSKVRTAPSRTDGMRRTRGRRPTEIADLQVNDAHLGGRAHGVARLGREADDPRAWVLDVYFGVARVDGGEGDAVPAAELDKVFDSEHGDAEHGGVAGEEQDAASRRKCDL